MIPQLKTHRYSWVKNSGAGLTIVFLAILLLGYLIVRKDLPLLTSKKINPSALNITLLTTIPEKYDSFVGNGTFYFSPDGKRVAYQLYKENAQQMIIDGMPHKEYEKIGYPFTYFSPDSKHFVYPAQVGKRHFIVLDGQESEPFGSITIPEFTANGKLIFKAWQNGNYYLVEGDEKRGPFVSLDSLVLSRNKKHFAYIARETYNDKGFSVILDNKIIGTHTLVKDLTFSESGEVLAYYAFESNGLGWEDFIVVGDKKNYLNKHNFYDDIIDIKYTTYSLALNHDGSKYVYAIEKDDGDHLVIDGKVSDHRFDTISEITFSLDGQRLAYVGSNAREDADKDEKNYVVIDGIIHGPYKYAGDPTFSNDSTMFAYKYTPQGTNNGVVALDGKDIVVYENAEFDIYDFVGNSKQLVLRGTYYPDIEKPLYNKNFISIGSKNTDIYDWAGGPGYFSTDGKKFYFGAKDNNNIFLVEVELDKI